MLFSLHCVDKPGGLAIRKENRPAHLEFLESHLDALVFAGPTLTDDGETPTGSLIILEVADRAAAEAFAAADPYAQAGVFESVTIKATRQVYPK
jgi:uncharacterized protein YciI